MEPKRRGRKVSRLQLKVLEALVDKSLTATEISMSLPPHFHYNSVLRCLKTLVEDGLVEKDKEPYKYTLSEKGSRLLRRPDEYLQSLLDDGKALLVCMALKYPELNCDQLKQLLPKYKYKNVTSFHSGRFDKWFPMELLDEKNLFTSGQIEHILNEYGIMDSLSRQKIKSVIPLVLKQAKDDLLDKIGMITLEKNFLELQLKECQEIEKIRSLTPPVLNSIDEIINEVIVILDKLINEGVYISKVSLEALERAQNEKPEGSLGEPSGENP